MASLAQEHKRLIDLLVNTRRDTQSALSGIDLTLIVHPDTGWQARDVLGHMAAWDEAAAKSLRAYLAGGGYHIPDFDIEAFNEAAYSAWRAIPAGEVIPRWQAAHDELVVALREVPRNRIAGPMQIAWGGQESVSLMIEVMAAHEWEHRREILRSVGR